MNAVNAVLLFILVCFTAVCQAEGFSVICDDVTGSVEKEVNLTCSVSLLKTDCCIRKYKFNELVICRKELPNDSCAQRNSFTCSYTPTTATTQPFRFFLQTTCGINTTEFTLNIPDESLDQKLSGTSAPDTAAGHGSRFCLTAFLLNLSIYIIIIFFVQ